MLRKRNGADKKFSLFRRYDSKSARRVRDADHERERRLAGRAGCGEGPPRISARAPTRHMKLEHPSSGWRHNSGLYRWLAPCILNKSERVNIRARW